ncbi:mediator of RNA polymerase II transcription subunit 14 [Aspergillus heteromorphus CBS 117.55]|uniref:Mediator of RNA polymerase II transcription subunit 14 n=1 Tax=Aspergillus heteromorphus CBS 117.55 TaxID=1448321 RepID=A0A317UTB0_9EURO|nr:mediator of RNA polymerase II transcription subunit 14 [Aspergillus heteromorphus CBS 117.55]PWY64536.1 mediator of RNA polymerase II transcription subunit 14 [Aspergillus heteromorphus CBS 117.55]
MPGVVMDDANTGGHRHGSGNHDSQHGIYSVGEAIRLNGITDSENGSLSVDGVDRNTGHHGAVGLTSINRMSWGLMEPPELPHIMQGFFPFSKLVRRSVQQCWNDLSDLITELAEIRVNSHELHSLPIPANGKSTGNQSSENIQKKVRILEFSHAKRAEFIKLLVLAQWSRQAADVSKLIDIQNFIRTHHQAYMGALQCIGDMKRDLVQAQVANPDLNTALEVLSKGRVASMSDLGYRPPKPLKARGTLRKLQKLNRIIGVRLAVQEEIPCSFQTYRVHDGRVTFIVPGEFELDLSVGEEDEASQFFFVDIHFLFFPSPPVPDGRILNELERTINDVLQNNGLVGCFNLLHGLVLTNKVSILFKQAMELARGPWTDVLRVELLHRTLVIQYWTPKPGAKSWLEIGIKRGGPGSDSGRVGLPFLGLRWIRDGEEVPCEDINFDEEYLSMERVLRSTIALHVSQILSSAYSNIRHSSLFSAGLLSLRAQLNSTEPGDCLLDVQLTKTRYLRVSVEPMSGMSILSVTSNALERFDGDRNPDKSFVDDIVARVARLRCSAAIEEIESNLKMLGFEPLNSRAWKSDVRKIFPPNTLRFTFFWHHLWKRNWVVAATSSMDGDSWWVVQLGTTVLAKAHAVLDANLHGQLVFRTTQIVSHTFFPASQHNISYTSLADLGHCLSGILAIHSNAHFLEDLQSIEFYPPLHKLKIEPNLRVPDIFIRYDASNLPTAFQLAMPVRAKRKSHIKDTVRLAFHGIDPCRKVAIMVAYGSLASSASAFGAPVSNWDRSLVFQRKGSGFALRFLAPAGHPIIIKLIESLQRLECVLSILESLQRKKIGVRTFSLSNISFTYGPERDFSASLNIDLSMIQSLMDLSPIGLASRTESIFNLRLGIQFGHNSPHRRIQESLASSLNHVATDAGLENVVEILSLTLPLMRALDQLMTNSSSNERLKVQVTVRNARSYQIHYPDENLKFQLVAASHLNRFVWVLKDVNIQGNMINNGNIKNKLQETLYNSRGDGWRGLGNGLVAEAGSIENLLREIERRFGTSQGRKTPEAKVGKSNNPRLSASSGGPGHTGSIEDVRSSSLATAPGTRDTQSGANTGTQKEDIIMID